MEELSALHVRWADTVVDMPLDNASDVRTALCAWVRWLAAGGYRLTDKEAVVDGDGLKFELVATVPAVFSHEEESPEAVEERDVLLGKIAERQRIDESIFRLWYIFDKMRRVGAIPCLPKRVTVTYYFAEESLGQVRTCRSEWNRFVSPSLRHVEDTWRCLRSSGTAPRMTTAPALHMPSSFPFRCFPRMNFHPDVHSWFATFETRAVGEHPQAPWLRPITFEWKSLGLFPNPTITTQADAPNVCGAFNTFAGSRFFSFGYCRVEPSDTDRIFGCFSCGREPPKLLKCSRCFTAHYCSTLCQHGDWRRHKPSCAKIDFH